MGRRGSRMALRGKPGLILVAVVVLLTIFGLYYFRSSSQTHPTIHEREHDHHHGHHHNSFNLGRAGNFDENKFIRKMENGVKPADRMENGVKPADRMENGVKPADGRNSIDLMNLEQKQRDEEATRKKEAERRKQIQEKQLDMVNDEELKDYDKLMKNGNDKENLLKEQLEEKVADKIQNRITDFESNQPEWLNTNEFESLYRKPNPDDRKLFEEMKHIVHLDFKGAAPTLPYFRSLFPILSSLGATGLLVEYEDMFPFSGELSLIAADNAYKKSDLIQFLDLAKENNLEIIPLVQTFGHLEFVLKYEKYSHLREDDSTPQVITPLVNETYVLLEKIIDQMMTVHANSKFLHLGCDEVYRLGSGKSKIFGLEAKDLFFQHVSRLVTYVKSKYPMVTPIIWDDQLRGIPAEMLRRYGLGDIIEPMIWAYVPNPVDRVSEDTWQRYGEVFKNVWGASSFKGATGSAQYFTDIKYHLSNHYGWIDIITKMKSLSPKMKFRGVAMTGWQRYDHFATLCELLPVAIPSLAVCLSTISNGGFARREHEFAQKQLGCSADFKECKFPGSDVYSLVQELKDFEESIENNAGLTSRLEGWLTDYHIKHGFSSPGQLRVLTLKLKPVLGNYSNFETDFQQSLSKYFDQPTVEEWIAVHIQEKLAYYKKKFAAAKTLMSVKTWMKRPLQGQTAVGQESGVVEQKPVVGRNSQTMLRNGTEAIRFRIPKLQNKIQKQAMKGVHGNNFQQLAKQNQQSPNNNPGLVLNHQRNQNERFAPNDNRNINLNAQRMKVGNHGNINSNPTNRNPDLTNNGIKMDKGLVNGLQQKVFPYKDNNRHVDNKSVN